MDRIVDLFNGDHLLYVPYGPCNIWNVGCMDGTMHTFFGLLQNLAINNPKPNPKPKPVSLHGMVPKPKTSAHMFWD